MCEAIVDALTIWCAGFRNVTTVYGVEGFTEEIQDALVSAGVRTVRIAFDRDEAGDRGAEKVAEKLQALGMETYRVVFPRGMDANAYALKVAPAEKSLEIALRKAEWMGRGARPANAPKPMTMVSAVTPSPPEPTEEATSSLPEIDGGLGEARDRAEHPSLAASAASAGPEQPGGPEQRGEDLYFHFGDRTWRVRGVGKEASRGEMRVNVLVTRDGGDRGAGGFFMDTVELYAAKQRAAFVKQAAAELELEERVIARELGGILLELEGRREAEAEKALAPKESPADKMTDVEREEAMALLKDPRLLERIVEDLERCGVVGEETNKLVTYLAATSRKLEEPLAVVIQSSSAAGKSSLMEAVLALFPEEEKVSYSAMTGQSLFYMSGQDLKHKVLAIAEEEGAERASYALKLLQSEGELTIASTGKDPATGRLVTQTYRVEGPVMILLTTTAIEVDEELLNRCLVLAVDEGREQTRAIHERQRRAQTLEGLVEREERRRIGRLYQNAQRLLRPLFVVNPFAPELSFADHATRTRRDHMKYLTLIRAVTLLHQVQRPVKTTEHRGQTLSYIESTREDVAMATRLAHAVLGRSLDELPPQTRRMLELVHEMVRARMEREGLVQSEVRFSRREVREWTRWSSTQVRLHLERLEELEYVLVHRVGRAGRGVVVTYELAYAGEGEDGAPFVVGLRDYDTELAGLEGQLAGSKRGQNGPQTVGYRGGDRARNSGEEARDATSMTNGAGKAHPGSASEIGSYA